MNVHVVVAGLDGKERSSQKKLGLAHREVEDPYTDFRTVDLGKVGFANRLTLAVEDCYLMERTQGGIEQAKKALIKSQC